MATPELLAQILNLLNNVGTTEAQLVASSILLLAAVVLSRLLAPRAIRVVGDTVSDRVIRGRIAEAVAFTAEYVPWRVPAWVFVRGLQTLIVGATGLAVLTIWGRFDLVVAFFLVVDRVVPVLVRFGSTIALLAGTYVGTDMLEDWLADYSARNDHLTQHQEEVSFRVIQLVAFGAAGLVALTIWDVDPSGLLVGAGFLGIVVGMAARQTLGSLIAGFVLMFARPFEVGDWVEVGDQEGIVTDITIVNTRLENFDGEFVVIPNDRVSDSTIINRSRKGRIRLRVNVGIDYEADIDESVELAEDAVDTVDEVMTVPRPQVVPNELGDSAVNLEIRAWIDKPSARRKTKAIAAIIRAVKGAFDREGVKIPYPQRELSGREETHGFRVRQHVDATNAVEPHELRPSDSDD